MSVEIAALERRLAEAQATIRVLHDQLAETEGRLAATVDTAADAILVIDEGGIVRSANPAVERVLGYRPDEIVGKSVNMLMPEPHRSTHDGYIQAYVRTGIAKALGICREMEAQRKDGSTIPIDLLCTEWQMGGKRFFTGIMRDITARKEAEEHIRFMMRELSHRTKNILAVVQMMAWKTARTSLDLTDFQERFANRIEALARSHDLLTKGGWQGVSLEDLVRGQLQPFGAEEQLDAHGPTLLLKPEAAQSLGLALHELATNASKYGALTCPSGRVEIGWGIVANGSEPTRMRVCWCERRGPEAGSPLRKGFGHVVIKEMVERALDGSVTLDFAPQGLFWELTAPVKNCLADAAPVAN